MKFQVDGITAEGIVEGMNGRDDIPLGTSFVAITKVGSESWESPMTSGEPSVIAIIDLRLIEVHWYRRLIDVIPGGHSAGLRLVGSGLEDLAAALASRQRGEYIHITANDKAGA